MKTGKKILTVAALLAIFTVAGWAVLIGVVYAHGGVMTVRVHESDDGFNLYLPVPMVVVDGAVATASHVMPANEWLELQAELDIGEWGPLVREVLEVLDDCPDAVLVEVFEEHEHVRVTKEGRYLKVEVEADDMDIKVSIPTRSVRRTVNRLFS